MQHTEKKIKIIRDKLSRIGIGEKNLDDAAILATYSINAGGHLCSVPEDPVNSSYFRTPEPSGSYPLIRYDTYERGCPCIP